MFHLLLTEVDMLHSDMHDLQQASEKPPVFFLESSWPRQKLQMRIHRTHHESEMLLMLLLEVVMSA